jgi:hypothetical protein
VAQVNAVVPEQVAVLDPQGIQAPFCNENPLKQLVATELDEQADVPPGL